MNDSVPLRVIGPLDTDLHPAYCDYVSRIFTQADFRRWCEWGQWSDDYLAFALISGGEIVANVAVMRMRLMVAGIETAGFQLGAVGCLPRWRGRGLARQAMQAAMAYCGDAPVVLFANDSVLDFYPRFGFSPAPQTEFEVPFRAEPAGERACVHDLADPASRREFLDLARIAIPSSRGWGARDYGRIATWYAANGYAGALRRLDERAWVFAKTEDGALLIEDVFAPEPIDLSLAIPRLIDRPVATIRFGFSPQDLWPGAQPIGARDDAGLFVRNLHVPAGPSCFPMLART